MSLKSLGFEGRHRCANFPLAPGGFHIKRASPSGSEKNP